VRNADSEFSIKYNATRKPFVSRLWRHGDAEEKEMNPSELWQRYKNYLAYNSDLGLMVDISRMRFPRDYFDWIEPRVQKAYQAMDRLESGEIGNPDEKRMVGHYWLRAPDLAPSPEISRKIKETQEKIRDFSAQVHSGKIVTPQGKRFSRQLVVGVGGSALGPQFLSHALGTPGSPMKASFLDNTDPDGIDRVLNEAADRLTETLTIVISKSGSTIDTRNGMLEAKAAYESRELPFGKFAVAITEAGSELERLAEKNDWLAIFPMWEWVGGRTSVTSAVGLLPAALQGIDIDHFLTGARLCDEVTRNKKTPSNPAALLALMWFHASRGQGTRDMVILPYKDSLQLFPKYLQQLAMESLGKERDLNGRIVNQGLTVYGNKGSTDQHAYVQQLRDGVNNFFITFIEVLSDRDRKSLQVKPDVTSGDYLIGFLHGTRRALSEKGRESITLTLERVDARSLGVLIALYERAVGLYASLINVNAYDQPGVEAGKRAAGAIIDLQRKALSFLRREKGRSFTAEEIACAVGSREEVENVFKVMEHAAANGDHGIKKIPATPPYDSQYRYVPLEEQR
jgi:glucose-6-phosphate isomerase